jgi:hypothetical protein
MMMRVGLEPTQISLLAPEASALTARPSHLMLFMENIHGKNIYILECDVGGLLQVNIIGVRETFSGGNGCGTIDLHSKCLGATGWGRLRLQRFQPFHTSNNLTMNFFFLQILSSSLQLCQLTSYTRRPCGYSRSRRCATTNTKYSGITASQGHRLLRLLS